MSDFQLIQNLLAMAAADGRISQAELQLLSDRCVQWGFNRADFEDALQHALAHELELEVPAERDRRVQLIRELILMMAADGVLHEREKLLLAAAAAVMKLDDDQLNDIVDDAIREHKRDQGE